MCLVQETFLRKTQVSLGDFFSEGIFRLTLKMGVSETLGVIFGALLLLVGIGVAVWFYFIRTPPAVVQGPSCTNDSDCE
jgi:hypothetical protein